MPISIQLTSADFWAVAPELILVTTGLLLVLLDAFAKFSRPSFPYIALAGVVIANFSSHYTPGKFFAGAIEASDLTRFVDLLTLMALALAILGGTALLQRDNKGHGEFFGLLLWSASGLMLMVKGNDLLIVFLGLELMSFGLYVLAAWYRELPEAVEAGMKYFLMGAFSSAFLLFGIATIYGRMGSTQLAKLAELSGTHSPLLDPLLALGLLAVIAALGFKLSLVPFHSWAPDVYQGMTTPAIAFLSTAPKAAAAIVMVRVLQALAPAGLGEPWTPLLAILATISILYGNVVALAQRDLKRMLAYSGIAQMGYAAIGLATFTKDAFEGLLFFLAGYLITNIAAFLAVGVLSNGEKGPHTLADLSGLGKKRPGPAWVLTIAMISLTGLPPTVGFIGKLVVFKAAVDQGLVWLTIVGVFGSLISVGYYLRVVYFLWMKEPGREVNLPEEDVLSGASYLLVMAGMLILGIAPKALLDLARAAASAVSLAALR
ncbi:MAG: NADH-quinone oxidoreductase subunit N [Acidobacteria bacterium]|nr:NADH-quinone oxidoreductase subunit N [Acidobacteriota bacterium]MCK6682023.1 NADH-quinone oxidoreductase subunit N [Thermoanaerobaculia bacterium]